MVGGLLDSTHACGFKTISEGFETASQMASKLAPTLQNKLLVSGYTDNTPIERELEVHGVTSNLILSQKRAGAVMQYLISQGVKPDLVSAKGFRDTNPVASNESAAGRAKNRRAELSLVGANG